MSVWGWALPGVVAGILLVLALGYNRLVRLRNRAESAYADIDVQLKRRYELIPNLVRTVQAYAGHERSLFETVTRARARAIAATGRARQAQEEEQVEEAVHRLLAVAEAHPELKADERFRALNDELVATEDKLAFSRQLYNDTVQAYRDATQSFPGVLYARPFGFEPPEFFTTDERAPVPVQLDEPEREE